MTETLREAPLAAFAARRLFAQEDGDRLRDAANAASETPGLVQQNEQATPPVEYAPTTSLNDELAFAHDALQRAFN